MGVYAGPDLKEDGLVLALDGANYKSFKGEDTYNYSRNSRDFSGTAYASADEWTDNPTALTKTYVSSIVTPIGNGATLIQESGSNGFHHLSRWGGGGETGAHSLSCYVFPLTSDITDFVIGLLGDSNNQISFNLNTRAITYGPGISNRDAFITPVVGFDGWYRVGANIEGRGGGWVGSIGYTSSATYTGTSGNKKCYITGIQYELKTKPTMFVEAQTTRGTTVATGGGWADLIGNGNHGELVNGAREDSANGGSLVFDGTDDYINCGTPSISVGKITVNAWIKMNTGSIYQHIVDSASNSWHLAILNDNRPYFWNNSTYHTSASVLGVGTWYMITGVQGTTLDVYVNGVLSQSVASNLDVTTNNVIIGGWQSASRQFNGNIAQVQIYNRALSASEIQQNFNANRARFGV